MDNEQQTKKWYRRAWFWVGLAAGALIAGLITAAIYNYLHLDQPRYWWPVSNGDWAAWGTWFGAAFTGGALLFAGFQFRLQSQALRAELANAADERRARQEIRFALAKQVRLEVDRKRAILWRARSSPELSGGRGYKDEQGQLTIIRVHCPAKSALTKVGLFLPAPPLLPARVEQPDGDDGSSPPPRSIETPMVHWDSGNFGRSVPDLSMGIALPDGKPGDFIKLTYVSPTDLRGDGVRVVFRDENGVDFHLDENGIVREYHGRENIGDPLSIR